MASRQLNYYYRHKAQINAKRKTKSKTENVKQMKSIPHIPTSEPVQESVLRYRLHRYQRTYKILNAVSEARLRSLRLNRLNNTNQYLGAGFRITTQHLEIEGLELVSDSRLDAAILEALAITTAGNMAQRLASTYGLLIEKEGQSPKGLMEIELNATQMTQRMEHKGLIELYADKEGYKVWVDWSFGIGGLESNKATYIQKLTDLANGLVEERWGIEQQLAFNQQSIERNERVEQRLEFLAQNWATHVEWMYAYLKAAKEGKPLPKKPKTDDPKQRRL